jgi:hypothetical protein
MLEEGIQLLDRFSRDDRVRQPQRNLQIKFSRPISASGNWMARTEADNANLFSIPLRGLKVSSPREPDNENCPHHQ